MLTCVADSQPLSSPSGHFPSMNPSWGKLLRISNSAVTPESRSTGTSLTQTSLDVSYRALAKSQMAHHNILKSRTHSTPYGSGISLMTTAKKSSTPRYSDKSNPTRKTKTACESPLGEITSSTPETLVPKLASSKLSN